MKYKLKFKFLLALSSLKLLTITLPGNVCNCINLSPMEYATVGQGT